MGHFPLDFLNERKQETCILKLGVRNDDAIGEDQETSVGCPLCLFVDRLAVPLSLFSFSYCGENSLFVICVTLCYFDGQCLSSPLHVKSSPDSPPG